MRSRIYARPDEPFGRVRDDNNIDDFDCLLILRQGCKGPGSFLPFSGKKNRGDSRARRSPPGRPKMKQIEYPPSVF